MTKSHFFSIATALFLAAFSQQASAQITVIASDFPGKGDTVRYSVTNNVFNNYTETGANFNWDFSNLTPQSQTLMKHFSVDDADIITQSLFGSTVIPKYRATYYLPARELPLATLSGLLDLPVDEIYRFYRKTNDEMTVIGLSISAMGFGIGKRADSLEIAYKFPMVFGQNFNSEGSVDLDLSAVAPFRLKQFRTRESEIDGWGTITTPYGTFECLRIHHIINEFDSVLIDLGNGPTWIAIPIPTIHEYEWCTNNQKGPILKAKANEIFGFQLFNEVMYRDIFRDDLNVSVADVAQNQIRAYPNPASTHLFIELNENVLAPKQMVVYNASGKWVHTFGPEAITIEPGRIKLDVKNLSKGIYFLNLGNNLEVLKISID